MAGNGSRSRTGCMDCRRRKRRCDEAKPECGSCRKHRVACVYVRPSQTSPTKFVLSVAAKHFILPLESSANESFVNIRSDEVALVCPQYSHSTGFPTITSQFDPELQTLPFQGRFPIPRALGCLPTSDPNSGSKESLLVQYYFEVISNSRVYVPTEKNPFRTSVMPVLLSNHGPLFSAVFALSAAEWGRRGLQDGVNYSEAAIQYKGKALTQLQSTIHVALDAEANLLTCVLQASLEIADGSQPSWLKHLHGAMAIMDKFGDWVSPDCAALVLQYFRFRYILMKTTEHRDVNQQEENTVKASLDECDESIKALNRCLPNPETWQTVDPQIGCSMELVELISMILVASTVPRSDSQELSAAPEEQQRQTDGSYLERRIRALEFYATGPDDEYLLKSAECFKFAALIYLRLVVFGAPIRYPSMTALLQPLIDSLSQVIVEDQRRRSFPMWPLFIAGCVSCTDAHRKAVLDLFNLLDSKWPISNISTVLRVVWTIWQTRDFDNGMAPTTQHDWQDIIAKFGWKLSLS